GKLLKNYTLDALIGLLLLPMLYFIFFEGIWGGTIGKLLLGIRVRRKDGGRSILGFPPYFFKQNSFDNTIFSSFILVFSIKTSKLCTH
ncbi:MAG: RDD family protein, partial [Bacteroidetes bacterium]|nr:RDD family protein [Bacteroidota bacterium]